MEDDDLPSEELMVVRLGKGVLETDAPSDVIRAEVVAMVALEVSRCILPLWSLALTIALLDEAIGDDVIGCNCDE